MKEQKTPKKPLIYYCLIAVSVLLLLNTFFFPAILGNHVTETTYSDMLKMLDEGKIKEAALDETIYVMTPQGRVVDLPRGATPIDFAYYVHTNVGHRCRGAKVNGQIVPLTTPLKTGQTVSITVGKQDNPSRDWLRDEFTASQRTRGKIRAWFNAQDTQTNMAAGRSAFEKELQRLGKTAVKHDEIAHALGFEKTDDLYIAFARELLGGRDLDNYFNGSAEAQKGAASVVEVDEQSFVRSSGSKEPVGKGGVLVVGLDDLMTQLAQCCKPAPPDEIAGFVTRGKGISIHRTACENFIHMKTQHPERVLACAWSSAEGLRYEVDMVVSAQESVDMMRLITDALAREKVYVTGLRKQKNAQKKTQTNSDVVCDYLFNLEVESTAQLEKARAALMQIKGVNQVARL